MPRTLLLVLAVCACTKRNPDVCCETAAECARLEFASEQPCGAGVCVSNVCVDDGCDGNEDCLDPLAPTCIEGSCRAPCSPGMPCGCATHASCGDSAACLPDGSCADPLSVAYVAADGSGATCAKEQPCSTLAAAVATMRPIVKVAAGAIVDPAAVVIDGRTLTVLADPGARVRSMVDGPIIDVRNAAKVAIYDLAISAEGLTAGDGIALAGDATHVPALTLERVIVSRNTLHGVYALIGDVSIGRSTFMFNSRGGLHLSGVTYDVTNSLIVQNGAPTSDYGGAFLNPAVGRQVFEFNTVSHNVTQAMFPDRAQLYCSGAWKVSNSIVAGRSANCIFDHTLFETGTPVDGTNRAGDPQFQDFIDPASPHFYRIGPASPAVDGAEVNGIAPVPDDIDGDPRPQGGGKDMGADESKP